MAGKFITMGADRHYCKPPGWRERRRLGVKLDALWRCDCGLLYRWDYEYMGGRGWDRVYEGSS